MPVPMNRKSADVVHLGQGVQFIYLDGKTLALALLHLIPFWLLWEKIERVRCVLSFICPLTSFFWLLSQGGKSIFFPKLCDG